MMNPNKNPVLKDPNKSAPGKRHPTKIPMNKKELKKGIFVQRLCSCICLGHFSVIQVQLFSHQPHTGSINDHKLLRQINDEQGPMFLFNNDIIKQEIHIPTCQVKQICCTGDQIGMSSANAKTIKNVLFYRPAINGKQACIVSRDLRVPCCECQLRCPDLRKDINVNYVSQTKVSTCTKWC
ncbi:uncharacterized protein LOC135928022 isoform X2 [Gordionus sp. m RMFG-2023]|uniref:uncharacterized protein LOC135928022 isoform X2 n=1 Tax=Gordionus sp. m RMFG-2023 TaxID=3053472 RepID=UPI0031FCF047